MVYENPLEFFSQSEHFQFIPPGMAEEAEVAGD
jgi:hypothetical protein